MAKQVQTLFLEDWIRTQSGHVSIINTSSKRAPQHAQAVIQAWADLRESLQRRSFQTRHLQSLKTLVDSHFSLYVADPQAKLILTILSLTDVALPFQSYPLFLRLLYIWVRKSSRPSVEFVDSAVKVTSDLLVSKGDSMSNAYLLGEGILLLGAFATVSSVSEGIRAACLESLLELLNQKYQLNDSTILFIPEILAGIGYSLSSAGNVHFIRLIQSLFMIWGQGEGKYGISHGLMLLHLTEWIIFEFINARSLVRIESFISEIFERADGSYSSFSNVMVSAGSLRVCNGSMIRNLRMDIISRLRISALTRLEAVAADLVPKIRGHSSSINDEKVSFMLQCISLAMSRCGQLDSGNGPLLVCACSSLLTEIFPLRQYYATVLQQPLADTKDIQINMVKKHLDSLLFKEAGAVSGVLCNLYALACEEDRHLVEDLVWNFCQGIYQGHRLVAFLLRGQMDEFLSDINKIAEAAFLMVVVFSLAVVRRKSNSDFSMEMQKDVSLKILLSLSCMEYFRRVRLPEYVETIRGVVVSVQQSEPACISFVQTMPSYTELTNPQECYDLPRSNYTWFEDDVQTARMLFYLRVVPTSVDHLPSSVFRNMVAAAMFLYMGHPNTKVARAAHSVFVSFMSSETVSEADERISLKEQLVFHYMKRSLKGYPGYTPFDGLASGVAALVQHLPAGSPSIYFAVHSLFEKTRHLCGEATDRENELWTNSKGLSEPLGKVLGLLSRLITLVDIQVLPELMQLWAKLVIQLPQHGQNLVLDELHDMVADSDDVTRKTSLVSWLQSLSYICSQGNGRISGSKPNEDERKGPSVSNLNARL